MATALGIPAGTSGTRPSPEDVAKVLAQLQTEFPYLGNEVVIAAVRAAWYGDDFQDQDQLHQQAYETLATQQYDQMRQRPGVHRLNPEAIITVSGQLLVVAALLITLSFVGFTSAPGGGMPQGFRIHGTVVNDSNIVLSEKPRAASLAFWYINAAAFFFATISALWAWVAIGQAAQGLVDYARHFLACAFITLSAAWNCSIYAFIAAAFVVLPIDGHAFWMVVLWAGIAGCSLLATLWWGVGKGLFRFRLSWLKRAS